MKPMKKPKLIHGDYFEITSELGRKSVNAIITDPPYDLDPYSFYLEDLREICRGNILAFCKPENQWVDKCDEYLWWIKTPSTKNFKTKCGRFVEIIMVWRQGTTFNQLHWSSMIGVYDDRHIAPTVHPFEKPLTLIERLVRIYTKPGDVVLDPFMGSGTTGMACRNLGREFIGIEKDKDYFKLAERRINGTS